MEWTKDKMLSHKTKLAFVPFWCRFDVVLYHVKCLRSPIEEWQSLLGVLFLLRLYGGVSNQLAQIINFYQ